MNTFMSNLNKAANYKTTENGAVAYKSTLNAVYDLFALGGAYRDREPADKILLFKKAWEENPELALKCLFWLRDIRGGAGEREMFRVCFNWLARHEWDKMIPFLGLIPEYGRWDDLIYSTYQTPCWSWTVDFIKRQLDLDSSCKTPSLCAKWCPSCNATSERTKEVANALRKGLDLTAKQYRKMLSTLRARINIVECLMSENRWDEIEFDQIPSVAGLRYRNAFARRDIIKAKYEEFAESDNEVNAGALFPYSVVQQALRTMYKDFDDADRLMVNKYWKSLPDYFEGKPSSMLCMIDTSGSMASSSRSTAPIDVAISLGLYCAERNRGPFADCYISFASKPQLIKTEGVDFVDKVERVYRANLIDNTNLVAAFDLLYDIAILPTTNIEDIPETLVVISDMEIDSATQSWNDFPGSGYSYFTQESLVVEMDTVRAKWAAAGLKMPKLVYWNVNARNDTILDLNPETSFVSGFSPIIFNCVMSGKTGWDMCLNTLFSDRYADIHL